MNRLSNFVAAGVLVLSNACASLGGLEVKREGRVCAIISNVREKMLHTKQIFVTADIASIPLMEGYYAHGCGAAAHTHELGEIAVRKIAEKVCGEFSGQTLSTKGVHVTSDTHQNEPGIISTVEDEKSFCRNQQKLALRPN